MFFKISKAPSYMESSGLTLDSPRQKFERARVICDASCQPWVDILASRDNDNRELVKQRIPWLGQFKTELSTSYHRCTCDACKCQLGSDGKPNPFAEWDHIDRLKLENLTDQEYFPCSRLIYGYVLKEREWYLLDIEEITDPIFNEDAIEKLVLEDDKAKYMIKAICSNFTQKQAKGHYSADFIQGKGESQIFLLHGPPGVEKTLTA
ncbi:hypothetical protein MMC14_007914, partial [Varicellaria rhodocarpa]|nr:hypothetical protein [Varicellaria rhodocarpa]